MTKNKKSIDISNYNIKLNEQQKNTLFVLIIVCLIGLLFKKKLNINVERILLFITLFSLLIVVTKNWVISVVTTVILFLLFNLLLNTQIKNNNIENFDNTNEDKQNDVKKKVDDKKNEVKNSLEEKKDELKKKIDSSDFINEITSKMQNYTDNKDVQSAANGLQDLLKQLDGGIKLKDSDTQETDKLNVDAKELSDEKKFDPMRKAQKDTYELINMVDSLKNTMETLAPVLSQGKEIMNMFENFKM
jgi:hypothetical protein